MLGNILVGTVSGLLDCAAEALARSLSMHNTGFGTVLVLAPSWPMLDNPEGPSASRSVPSLRERDARGPQWLSTASSGRGSRGATPSITAETSLTRRLPSPSCVPAARGRRVRPRRQRVRTVRCSGSIAHSIPGCRHFAARRPSGSPSARPGKRLNTQKSAGNIFGLHTYIPIS
jgi:hypothetical protein